MILLILSVASFLFVHAEERVLFEMYKSKTGTSERYELRTDGKKDVLLTTSNRLNPKILEFGVYERAHRKIDQKLAAIATSQKKNFQEAGLHRSPHDWTIKVHDKSVDGLNPRYGDLFNLVSKEVRNRDWRPIYVTQIEIDGPSVIVKKILIGNKKPLVEKKNFFEVCNHVYEGEVVCELDGGFVFIP